MGAKIKEEMNYVVSSRPGGRRSAIRQHSHSRMNLASEQDLSIVIHVKKKTELNKEKIAVSIAEMLRSIHNFVVKDTD